MADPWREERTVEAEGWEAKDYLRFACEAAEDLYAKGYGRDRSQIRMSPYIHTMLLVDLPYDASQVLMRTGYLGPLKVEIDRYAKTLAVEVSDR